MTKRTYRVAQVETSWDGASVTFRAQLVQWLGYGISVWLEFTGAQVNEIKRAFAQRTTVEIDDGDLPLEKRAELLAVENREETT